MNLTEFLLARIGEDQEVAREAAAFDSADWFADGGSLGPGKEPGWYSFEYIGSQNARHAARWDPARVLAECESKRRIVREHELCPFPTLAILALPFADHPDYRPEWRP